jgi:hypothetical protein
MDSHRTSSAQQPIAGTFAPRKYITFFYAVVDAVRMRLDYCSAGHNPPMLQHRDGTPETFGAGDPLLHDSGARAMPAASRNSRQAIVWCSTPTASLKR